MERQDFDVDLFRAGAGLRGSVHVSDRTTDGSLNADGTVKVPQGPLPVLILLIHCTEQVRLPTSPRHKPV